MKSLITILLMVFVLCGNVLAQELDEADFIIIKSFESQLSSKILQDFYGKATVNLWDITSTYYNYKDKAVEECSIGRFLEYCEKRFLESHENKANVDHFIAKPLRVNAFKRKVQDDYTLLCYLSILKYKRIELIKSLAEIDEKIKAIDILRQEKNIKKEKEEQ